MNYIADAFETYQFMSERDILIAFTGPFDHHVTTSLLKNIKRKLNQLESSTSFKKKIYSMLVESIENVSKHSSHENGKAQNTALLLLCRSSDKYTIITGNHILNEYIPDLTERLERVSKHDQSDLKVLYQKQILAKRMDANNSGLGIIDMGIKSGNKMKYKFRQITPLTSFYMLEIDINFDTK